MQHQTSETTFIMEANTMNPDQTAPKEAVWSGSMSFTIYSKTCLKGPLKIKQKQRS